MALKLSKPKTSKKQKPEKKISPPKKKRKPVPSKKNNNNVKTTQQGLVNQAAKTGNQTTVVRINNALAKASARVNRRYAGIPKPPIQYAQPSIGIAPAFNIQFPSLGANYDNGMREVNGMRNDIINEFRRLNPQAVYGPPPPPPAPPGAAAVAAAPPPMSVHPDAVYEEPVPVPPATPPSVHTEPGAEAIDIDNEIPVPGAPLPQAPQDPLHVGANAANPVAQGEMPQEQNYVDLGDAEEPLLDQLFPGMADGATATETSSEGTPAATTRSRGATTVDFDNAVRPMELEFNQPAVVPEVSPPPDEILPGERRNPRGREEIIPNQEQITHQQRLNQEEEDDRQLARRPQAWQEYSEQARMDRGLTPERLPAMHLADMAEAMENGTQRRGRGVNNRPGTNRPGSLPQPQPVSSSEPVFDQTNQQNMLEHMETPSGVTETIPGFPEIPADLDTITFDAFPQYPRYLNNGPPTSPLPAFIDDYLNPPTSPQGQLGFQGQQPTPIVPASQAPAAAPLQEVVTPIAVPLQEVAPATGITTGTTPKPRSPRRSRSPPNNPNRLIAPNTPAEGIARPLDDSTRAQTPDARAEQDVNDVPTKGPLRVRKNTIAAMKRAEKARQTRTQSPTASNATVKRARRARPEPGAMTISPDSSAQRKMPTDQ
jgi:hypothetical protein